MESEEKQQELQLNKHFITFFSFIITSLILILIGTLIKVFVPDALNIDFIVQNFNMPLSNFVAEKSEKIQYDVLILSFPFIYILAYKWFSKVKPVKDLNKMIFYISLFEFLASSALFIVLNKINPHFFSLYPGILLLIIISAFLLFLIYSYATKPKYRKSINLSLGLISAFILCLIFALYYTPTYNYSYASEIHFDAYYYPIYKVFSGLTIGKDFNNLYGLYPYFYEIIFKLTGGISILKMSFINASLIVLSLISVFSCIIHFVKNRALLFLGFLTYVYLLYINNLILKDGFYLQFLPHRVLFISLLIGLAGLYLKNIKNDKLNKILSFCGYFLSFLSIIWNLETGFIVSFAWFLFLIYIKLFNFTNLKQFLTDGLKIFLKALFPALAAFGVIYSIPFFRTGQFIPISQYFMSQSLFYKNGFFMIKMDMFSQPWLILIITYMIAFIKSLNSLPFMNKEKINYDLSRSAIYFLLSIIGFGIFIYYQGRSHVYVLAAVCFPCVLLALLFMQEYFDNFFKLKADFKNIARIYFLKFLAIFLVFSIFSIDLLYICSSSAIEEQRELRIEATSLTSAFNEKLNFLKYWQKQGKLDLFMLSSDIYYTFLNEKDEIKLQVFSDWVSKKDYDEALDWLEKTDNIVVFDDYAYKALLKYEPQRTNKVMKRFQLLAPGKYLYVFKAKRPS